MSEKREGWLGWMNEPTLVNRSGWVDNSDDGPHGAYKVPVWVAPLDPDGPKPGETWRWDLQDVEIVTAPWVDRRGDLCVVIRAGVREIPEYVSNLSPIKPTRTVTLEVTEEEREAVRQLVYGESSAAARSLARKLAEALEDE